MRKILGSGLIVVGLLGLTAKPLSAIPILQLYAEGATYDSTTQTWVIQDWSTADPLRIWAIGNVQQRGTISNVHLSIAYSSDFSPVIQLTPSTTGGFGGFTDPSTPSKGGGITDMVAGDWIKTVTDGSAPVLSDGSALPWHGEYGAGTSWQEFDLGDFTLMDSPMADFIYSFPTTLFPTTGQINVYELKILSGVTGNMDLHIDLYDSVQARNRIKSKFAPFSHDASATAIPEPGALLLLGSGLSGLLLWGRSRTRR